MTEKSYQISDIIEMRELIGSEIVCITDSTMLMEKEKVNLVDDEKRTEK